MSLARAGHLTCICPPAEQVAAAPLATPVLAAGFGLAVLAQSLALAGLPVAASVLAPGPLWQGAPYAVWVLGGLIASFPASILSGLFGRRAAFALGASLGLAGGALAGWGFYAGQFPALLLGAFWLGLAQGFGLFYRHMAGGEAGAMLRKLFGAGALAVAAAPLLALALRQVSAIYEISLLLASAGVVSFLALGLSMMLPVPGEVARFDAPEPQAGSMIGVTLAGFFAWAVMAALMGATPAMMRYCGFGVEGASAMVAWHMLAMYVPGAVLASFADRLGVARIVGSGLMMLALALILALGWHQLVSIGAALTLAGAGWSLVMMGATLHLQRQSLSRLGLAGHDAALFLGAMIGALARPLI